MVPQIREDRGPTKLEKFAGDTSKQEVEAFGRPALMPCSAIPKPPIVANGGRRVRVSSHVYPL